MDARLRGGTLAWSLGAAAVRVRSGLPALAEGLLEVYRDHPVRDPDRDLIDFGLRIDRPLSLKGALGGQAVFESEGESPFDPMPRAQAPAILEWGLNWCVARHAHWFLMTHAASLHRNGRALVLPGVPGTGKSTLCAALVHAGWELLSDEFALVSLEDGTLHPLWKPISLKEPALELFRQRPGVRLSSRSFDSAKGRVGFWCLGFGAGGHARETARPAWIAELQYAPGASLDARAMRKSEAFLSMAQNSFNYGLLGASGFDALFDLVEACDCFDFRYSDLDAAVAFFEELAGDRRARA